MVLGILYREELKEYDFGEGHPFRSDRYETFPHFLRNKLPPDENYRFIQTEFATINELLLICTKAYINFTKDYFTQANLGSIPYDMQRAFNVFHSMDNKPRNRPGKIEEAARLIIGQAKKGIDLVQSGIFRKVVSIGGGMHHAKPSYGEGFCIYNDVAFSAKYLIEKYNLERILILDTDAHAGNGTSEYFYSVPEVLFIDLHQDPNTLYPGTGFINETGSGKGEGYTINIPMPVHASDRSYRLVFDDIVLPIIEEYKPQIVIRNGGSDPHHADELTNLGLSIQGLQMIGAKVRQIADKMCEGKVIDLLASGYSKQVLPYGWLSLISGLANFQTSIEEPIPPTQILIKDPALKATKNMIKEIKKNLITHWRCLN